METTTIVGVLLDDAALDLHELARACGVEPDWVVRHVCDGLLGADEIIALGFDEPARAQWRFRSGDLQRARRLVNLEHDLDANEEIAALVLDLADEVSRLRTRLRVLGAL
ncbi:MerR family transcriptional regulator [Massilia sp. CCM 8733]|uniref:MerR family transcriptional regulator n=1 Tax=Massilia mucilaginosa TaxID=2609282 RepID=A0ABX0NRU2_9BURK|nr:chaperone modulator CbpM [Massilia mucilaginosa]NHZ89489.1 MerR family transcriptional regulator [Massilia mucilaginosa]